MQLVMVERKGKVIIRNYLVLPTRKPFLATVILNPIREGICSSFILKDIPLLPCIQSTTLRTRRCNLQNLSVTFLAPLEHLVRVLYYKLSR